MPIRSTGVVFSSRSEPASRRSSRVRRARRSGGLTAAPRGRRREGGFTLLELLVALALATIIGFCITFVSTQAQKIYVETTAKVEVYQKFRYALADLQKSLENMVPTADLEFFVDRQSEPNGHWEEGEEIRDKDNLQGGNPREYDEAAQIIERTYVQEGLYGDETHDNFSIYFKAPVDILGATRMANIEYYLADPERLAAGEDGRLPETVGENKGFVLIKVVRFIDTDASDFFKSELEVRKKVIELCQNVTDLRIEYFADNFFDSKPGRFLVPSSELAGEISSETRIRRLADGALAKEFIYGGFRQGRGRTLRGTAFQAIRDTRRGDFRPVRFDASASGIRFSELGLDDKIYIWTDAGTGKLASADYTVLRNENGRIIFQERIDTSSWTGQQTGLRFKAGFIPGALRVTIRVLNDSGREPRTLSTVIQTIRKNR